MSPRQWCALFCFYTAYLFFGASVFYYTEREYEVERRLQQLQERIEINELLSKYTAPNDEDVQHDILHKVTTYCGKKVTNHTLDKYVDPYQWTFYHSVFFAFTVCSTLGYGNIAPTQTFGQYFMIVYALVGIPVNGILYAYLGDYFGETFIGAYSRYKNYKMANDKDYVPRRWNMIAQITLYLVPAAVVLIFLPSCLFTYFEGWPYSVSVYYSFVTLSTIGFGDFIPTFQPHQERVFGVWFQLYQAFIIIWFVFGLSYLLMLIGFIARGMRSKQITRLEHQLSENIKLTQQRIWTGVTRDVSYLRKIFNEIYIMRFKPAYDSVENGYVYNILTRSESCPNLAMYHPHYTHHAHHHHHGHHGRRRRAHSEHDAASYQADHATPDPTDGLPPTRRSDADLLRCDRQRTLDDPLLSIMHTGDVLARVVQALGSIGQQQHTVYASDRAGHDGGYHGLSDSQILADEAPHSECPTPPRRPRLRAASEYRGVAAADRPPPAVDDSHEWTWNGTNAQIAELRKMRARMNRTTYDLHRQAVSGAQHAISIEISPPTPQPPSSGSVVDPMRTPPSHWPASSRKHSVIDVFEPSASSRRSSVHTDAVRRQYANATQRGRPSVFAGIAGTDQELLEKTTIADLLRAIEVAHIQEHIPDTVLMVRPEAPSARRSPRLMGAGNRRASMFPGYHSCLETDRFKSLSRRASLLPETVDDDEVAQPIAAAKKDATDDGKDGDEDEEDDEDDLGPPEPPTSALFHKHQKSRRASMFPANFKSFQKLTETILNDGIGGTHLPPAAITPQMRVFKPAVQASRRASMCPTRRLAAHSNAAATSPLIGQMATHTAAASAPTHRAGRRVSLIPGAGRHAIPERLLREYAHVPRETHALSRQHHRASGRQTRHFLSAPIGGAFAMPMSPARRKNSATASTATGSSVQRLTVAAAVNGSPLMRDARTTASSPHLSIRRDSAQLLQPQQQPQQRGNVRHHVFRPFQAGGEPQVSESAHSGGSESE